MVERSDNRSLVKYERGDSCQVHAISSVYRNKLKERSWGSLWTEEIKEQRWRNHMGRDQSSHKPVKM